MTETPDGYEARKAEWERIPSQEEIDAAVKAARRPAVLLNRTKFPDDPGEPGCWIRGEPSLPPEVEWPFHNVRGTRAPLHFVAQVNLARVPRSDDFPAVPETGTVFFFCDQLFRTYDSRVVFCEEDVSTVPPRAMPELPQDDRFWEDPELFFNDDFLDGKRRAKIPKKWNFDFLHIDRFDETSVKNRQLEWAIMDASQEALEVFKEQTRDRWGTPEPGSLQRMPAPTYMFGWENTGDVYVRIREDKRFAHLPRDGTAVLLLSMSGAIVLNFWIIQEDLEACAFHRAFMTEED